MYSIQFIQIQYINNLDLILTKILQWTKDNTLKQQYT